LKEKSGKWILLDECANSGYYCSNCQKKLVKEGWSNTVKKINYCPNCGACMKDGRTLDEFIEDSKESEDKE
jgi:Zn-finger nucleic acid-binding protein